MKADLVRRELFAYEVPPARNSTRLFEALTAFLKVNPSTIRLFPPILKFEFPVMITLPNVSARRTIGRASVPLLPLKLNTAFFQVWFANVIVSPAVALDKEVLNDATDVTLVFEANREVVITKKNNNFIKQENP